jgi:hypothetical protein
VTPANEILYGGWLPGTDLFLFTSPVPITVGNWCFGEVAEGYKTNFCSTPRFLWRIIPPTDKHLRRASAGHDYHYDIGYPKLVADAIWMCVAKEDGAPAWKYIGGFIGLALFGWGNYNKAQIKKKESPL